MKGIYRRKTGLYEGRFQINGKIYYVSGKTKKDVEKKLVNKRYEVEHGMYSSNKDSLTVDSWFNTWIEEYKKPIVKDRTVRIYLACYKCHIKNAIGHRKLKDIRGEHLQRIFNNLAKNGLSKGTLGNVKKTLNGMFEQAVLNDILFKNPVKAVRMPSTKEKEKKKVLTVEEQRLLLEEAKESNYYELIVFALNTGMRIGEITGLKWSDIDFNENIIKVRRGLNYYSYSGFYTDTPKTKKSIRDIPMTSSVRELLKRVKHKQLTNKIKYGSKYKEHPTIKDTVFTSIYGGLIHEQMVSKELKKLCNLADIERVTPHALRHTFATRCAEKGMSYQTLKSIMGHAKLSITMDLYAHVLQDTKQQEIKLLEG